MLNKLLVATGNPSKKERYQKWFANCVDQVVSLTDLGIVNKPEEIGQTAEENSRIKAFHYARLSGLPAFSEDTSLLVDFLPENEQPGVYLRRINGRDDVTDDELLAYWETKVAAAPPEKRTGRWHIAYSLATPDGKVQTGARDAEIMFFSPSSKVRMPGFPMSSLQGGVKYGKPHSELTESERQQNEEETNAEIVSTLLKLFE